jgi:hypothetical protein
MENRQQLDLISEMIATARKEFNQDGTIFLLWGWLVAIASISQYVLIKMDSEYNSLPWLLMIVGMIAQFVIMHRNSNRQRVKTHVGKVIGYTWMAFGISLGITLFMQGKLLQNTFPMVMILYAIGIFISGAALQVRALIIGAIACWCCAIAAFFVNIEEQLLLLAAAVIMAYIIPGYVLNAKYKKAQAA